MGDHVAGAGPATTMLAIMDKYAKVLSTVEADLKPPELSGVGPSDRERWLTTCQRLANDAKAIVQASEAEGVEQVEKDAFDRHIECESGQGRSCQGRMLLGCILWWNRIPLPCLRYPSCAAGIRFPVTPTA